MSEDSGERGGREGREGGRNGAADFVRGASDGGHAGKSKGGGAARAGRRGGAGGAARAGGPGQARGEVQGDRDVVGDAGVGRRLGGADRRDERPDREEGQAAAGHGEEHGAVDGRPIHRATDRDRDVGRRALRGGVLQHEGEDLGAVCGDGGGAGEDGQGARRLVPGSCATP